MSGFRCIHISLLFSDFWTKIGPNALWVVRLLIGSVTKKMLHSRNKKLILKKKSLPTKRYVLVSKTIYANWEQTLIRILTQKTQALKKRIKRIKVALFRIVMILSRASFTKRKVETAPFQRGSIGSSRRVTAGGKTRFPQLRQRQ